MVVVRVQEGWHIRGLNQGCKTCPWPLPFVFLVGNPGIAFAATFRIGLWGLGVGPAQMHSCIEVLGLGPQYICAVNSLLFYLNVRPYHNLKNHNGIRSLDMTLEGRWHR